MSSLFFPGVSTLTHVYRPKDEIDPALFKDDGLFSDGYDCKYCNEDARILIEKEEVICLNCGTHYGHIIDSAPEYRWFGSDDRSPDPTRVGHPVNAMFPESSRGTRVLIRPGDNKEMRRIRQYIQWNVMPYRERTLWGVFELLHIRAAQFGISNAVVEETKQLYAQVSPRCISRGKERDALLAACLFDAYKRHGTPRLPSEVAEIFQLDVKLITRGFKKFAGLLDEHMYVTEAKNTVTHVAVEEEETETHSTGFQHYLEPALSRLLTPRAKHGLIVAFAVDIGKKIDLLGICPETTPSSLAGSALLLACDQFELEKTVAEVAKVCSISTATLQKCLKRIQPWRAVLFGKKTDG